MRVDVVTAHGAVELDDGVLDADRAALAGVSGVVPRRVYAAAHLVLRDGYAGEVGEALVERVDWEATAGVRRFLAGEGFGVAEAMDTAQRFQIGWPVAKRLIEECGALGLGQGFVAGAGTDQRAGVGSRAELVDAVVEQCAMIRAAGGVPVVLPMPWLVAEGCGPEDYVDVYRAIVRQAGGPLLVHWLGAMFLPELDGYFPGDSFDRVMDLDPEVVCGCKLSLLDSALELRVRRRLLPRGQVVFTGDDFAFGRLMRGGDPGVADTGIAPVESWRELDGRPLALGDFSHALLGVFDAIARPASLALRALAAGDVARWERLMTRCEALGRHVFAPPTRFYKTSLAFLSWLNGRQPNPLLVAHEERARDLDHLLATARLASRCGAIDDAILAAERLLHLAKDDKPHPV